MISADSHFVQAPHMWSSWLPRQYRDRAPQLVDDGDGGEGWLFAGWDKPEPIGLQGLPGRPADNLRPSGVRYDEIRRGTYDGAARLQDQEEDGVDGEVIFPTSHPIDHFLDDPDRDFVMAGVAAYNNFVKEEFCAPAPHRLFPVAQLPTTGVADCISVLEDAAARGFVAASLPSWPDGGDQLSAETADFWACAQELGLPICMHVGFRGRKERIARREVSVQRSYASSKEISAAFGHEDQAVPLPLEYHRKLPNFGVGLARAAPVLSDLLLSGIFDVYPRLRIGLIETWVGWVPRALEAVDDIWERNRHLRRLPLRYPPSTYWHTNMVSSFIDDRAGIQLRNAVGIENMMWSSDYPHIVTFWPRSRKVVENSFLGVSGDDRTKILRQNCINFYGLGNRIATA